MEIAKQIIQAGKDSVYLREQTETLNAICSSLWFVDRGGHLAHFHRLAVRHATEVIEAMADQHRHAIKEVEAHEREQLLIAEKVKDSLKAKTVSLNTAGKMALVEFVSKFLRQSNQLTIEDAEAYLIGEPFDKVNQILIGEAILHAKRRNLAFNVAVDHLWDYFESERSSIEKKLSRKIRAYEKQLAVAAEGAKLKS